MLTHSERCMSPLTPDPTSSPPAQRPLRLLLLLPLFLSPSASATPNSSSLHRRSLAGWAAAIGDSKLWFSSSWSSDGTPAQEQEEGVARGRSSTPVGCCCCECWNTTGEEALLGPFRAAASEGWTTAAGPSRMDAVDVECRCSGDALRLLPQDLDPAVRTLTVAQTAMETLHRDSFKPYRDTLRDVVLMEMTKLQHIEPGIFRHMKHLRTIYISQAPALKVLSPGIFQGISSSLYTLRIVHTGLEEVPDLREVGSGIMQMIDLENNGIKEVRSNSIRVKAEHVLLNYNAIVSVDGWAFNGSEIAKLSLKGNRMLTTLSQDAFSGLKSLREM